VDMSIPNVGLNSAVSSRTALDPRSLSVPVLQAKLRSRLGQNYRLPSKRADLVKLAEDLGLVG
jgi:hypothetical protein